MFVLVSLSVRMDSCACACISKYLYGLLSLCLYFLVFVWTLVFVLVFLGVCMDSCACFTFLSVCMDSCAFVCISKYFFRRLCLCLYF